MQRYITTNANANTVTNTNIVADTNTKVWAVVSTIRQLIANMGWHAAVCIAIHSHKYKWKIPIGNTYLNINTDENLIRE